MCLSRRTRERTGESAKKSSREEAGEFAAFGDDRFQAPSEGIHELCTLQFLVFKRPLRFTAKPTSLCTTDCLTACGRIVHYLLASFHRFGMLKAVSPFA